VDEAKANRLIQNQKFQFRGIRMRSLLTIILVLTALSAQAVTVTQDNRYVVHANVQSDVGWSNIYRDAPAAKTGEQWTGGYVWASQTSLGLGTLPDGELGFYAQGSVEGYTDGYYYTETESSIFDVTLLMDQDMNLALTSTFFKEVGADAYLRVYINRVGGSQLYDFTPFTSQATDTDIFNYLLEAGGEYRIQVQASSNAYEYSKNNLAAGYDVVGTLTATVVPIPGAVWLFGSALAGLGWMRRKHTV
jgi:hypothetical protein